MVSLCICFPGGTFVTTRHGVKQLDELLQGEEVLTLTKQSQKWTQFYTWGKNMLHNVYIFIYVT